MQHADKSAEDHLDAVAIGMAKELIKHFEGYRFKSYRCPGGVLTIGWGHTAPGEWQETGVIDEEEAEMLLLDDIMTAWSSVKRAIRPRLYSRQKAAVVSFVFNLGAGSFLRSTLLKEINAGRYLAASHEFLRWKYAAGVALPGLERRRAAEAMVWCGEDPQIAIAKATKREAL